MQKEMIKAVRCPKCLHQQPADPTIVYQLCRQCWHSWDPENVEPVPIYGSITKTREILLNWLYHENEGLDEQQVEELKEQTNELLGFRTK